MNCLYVIKKGKKYINYIYSFTLVKYINQAQPWFTKKAALKHIQIYGEPGVTYQIQKVKIKECK
jgi:hypothetical protein